ncbi:uncharacterized protein LOC133890311 [Phragmites australis]|uniref:uncharacterized protein LOC133890311 n=1 Tax=Phragmites australis TaxID=29695 RepID=UPI002D76E481|nr:uncharacterized protein LOC133890311 [Phragmites australis]
MPTMTVQSATMRRLRRELENSRSKAALAPRGGVAKKPSSAPSHISSAPPRCSAPTTPLAPRRVDGDARLDRARPSSVSPSRHAGPHLIGNSSIREGAQVRVRTPVGTLRTGQRLVLWLSAVVVSAVDEEDGYLSVVYNNGTFPRDDPFGTVRVARKHVKNMPPTAASTGSSTVVTTDRSSHPSQNKAALRPTVAGKKLPLLKKLEKDMQRCSKAIMDCW